MAKSILPIITGPKGTAAVERFHSLYERGGDNDCWPWQAGCNDKGYGRFKAAYQNFAAPRFALVLATGEDRTEQCTRHSCDNPACVNPRHLQWGTFAENSNDKVERGRARTGDHSGFSNPRVRITPEQLAFIIDGFKSGQNNRQIAARLPIGESMVSRIRVGLSFREQAEALGWFGTRPRAFTPPPERTA